MAATVKEIMNPELFRVMPSDSVAQALAGVLALGITGAAVLDAEQRPIGVVSLRDLVDRQTGTQVADRMTSPALIIREDARVAEAARLIGESGYRRLVVVGADGRAVGMVSAVDVIRALVGLPAQHPVAFPHLDRRTGLEWSDLAILNDESIARVTSAPGIIELVHEVTGQRARVVWIEGCQDLQARLTDLLSLPQTNPELTHWLELRDPLWFRTAVVTDAGLRSAALDELRSPSPPAVNPRALG